MTPHRMKIIIYSFLWLFATTGLVLSSIAFFSLITYGSFTPSIPGWQPLNFLHQTKPEENKKAESQELHTELAAGDARVILVQNFLERHNSPILKEDSEFASFLVHLADEQGIDFRLLPAIAMQESNLCKAVPEGTHNCLGLGIHARGTWGFETYRENFTAAAKILKTKYIDIGLTTTELIEKKYNPTSHTRDGSWASSVNQWMAEMRYDDRGLGKSLKSDADLLEFTTDSPSARN